MSRPAHDPGRRAYPVPAWVENGQACFPCEGRPTSPRFGMRDEFGGVPSSRSCPRHWCSKQGCPAERRR